MAIVTNADGLQQSYGLDSAKQNKVGAVKEFGTHNKIKINIEVGYNGMLVGTTGAKVTPLDNVVLPAGALIVSAKLVVLAAFTSGGSATLDVGMATTANPTTELDYDGLIAATALSTINAVGKQVTGAGALVGGVGLTANGVFYVKANTAAFTAGRAEVTIEYKTGTTV